MVIDAGPVQMDRVPEGMETVRTMAGDAKRIERLALVILHRGLIRPLRMHEFLLWLNKRLS
jgi:hypothetical protein